MAWVNGQWMVEGWPEEAFGAEGGASLPPQAPPAALTTPAQPQTLAAALPQGQTTPAAGGNAFLRLPNWVQGLMVGLAGPQGYQTYQGMQDQEMKKQLFELRRQQESRQALVQDMQTLGQIVKLPKAFQKVAMDRLPLHLGDDVKQAFLKQSAEEQAAMSSLLGQMVQDMPQLTRENVERAFQQDPMAGFQFIKDYSEAQERQATTQGLRQLSTVQPSPQAGTAAGGTDQLANLDRAIQGLDAQLAMAIKLPQGDTRVNMTVDNLQNQRRQLVSERERILTREATAEDRRARAEERADIQARLREQHAQSLGMQQAHLALAQEGMAMRREEHARKATTQTDALAETVLAQPELFSQLSPSLKAQVAPKLKERGFSAFGKPLSESAIKQITQTESAIEGLSDLRQVVKDNEQYIGPVAGMSALNPYSKARQVHANMALIKQRVGKSLEGGVLREADEKKYKEILAKITDTPETARAKIDLLVKDIQRDIANFKKVQEQSGRVLNIQGTTPTPARPGTPTGPQAPTEAPIDDTPEQASYRTRLKALGMSDDEINAEIGR